MSYLIPFVTAPNFHAIQLSNTENRSWSDKTDNASNLTFAWWDIKGEHQNNLEDLSIAIAKAHSDYSPEKIKSIARGIKAYPNLREGDGVLGVKGKKLVAKIGLIKSKKKSGKHVELNIEWNEKIEAKEVASDLFNEISEIQNVGKQMLSKLNLPISIEGGFKTSSTSFKSLDLEHFESLGKKLEDEDSGGRMYLFYGTNRNDTGSLNPNEKYGNEISNLKVGTCGVSIPPCHREGLVERPINYWIIRLIENDAVDVILKEVEEIPEDIFYNEIEKVINRLEHKSALIFIHGFNNSFAQAARQTAQIAWDVAFKGISGFFSWPSDGSIGFRDYEADGDKSEASITALADFIECFIEKTEVKQINLIAHSMGNRVMTYALKDLANKAAIKSKLSVINQIILGAPDIDQDVFRTRILPNINGVGNRKTLYSSSKDRALSLSEFFRKGRPRLGDAGTDLFVTKGLDTIDATYVKSSLLGHSYIFETKELLMDLYLLLHNGLPPLNRRLTEKQKESIPYWLFTK